MLFLKISAYPIAMRSAWKWHFIHFHTGEGLFKMTSFISERKWSLLDIFSDLFNSVVNVPVEQRWRQWIRLVDRCGSVEMSYINVLRKSGDSHQHNTRGRRENVCFNF